MSAFFYKKNAEISQKLYFCDMDIENLIEFYKKLLELASKRRALRGDLVVLDDVCVRLVKEFSSIIYKKLFTICIVCCF